MNKHVHNFLKSRFKSFKYAFEGVNEVWKEANFRIHIIAAGLAIGMGLVFAIERVEWLAVIGVITLVLLTEMMNTAIERLSDVVSPEKDERIKVVKDVSAAAVLVSAVLSLLVGIWVFLPKLIVLL